MDYHHHPPLINPFPFPAERRALSISVLIPAEKHGYTAAHYVEPCALLLYETRTAAGERRPDRARGVTRAEITVFLLSSFAAAAAVAVAVAPFLIRGFPVLVLHKEALAYLGFALRPRVRHRVRLADRT